MMSPRLTRFFEDYEADHVTLGNQLCHVAGIPLIVLSALGLLGHVPLFAAAEQGAILRADAGLALWGAGMLWYLFVDWRISIPFGILTLGFYFIGRAIPMSWLAGLFIAGWVFQAVGHAVFEHRRPAFFRNLQHLLVGPLWIFARLTGYP